MACLIDNKEFVESDSPVSMADVIVIPVQKLVEMVNEQYFFLYAQ
ncbi:hypothetical protein Krac_8835 [Ktedonobacter racemifer DSM 44963]|uniref:Uncharacterized protein n=1 Tax=Ktedonobacter racemifer DSM 44963 TaxID=485913 RepID=D6TPR6_KTERA|nr:hypothetical protein Krac_8835 [Ktedonobacter racemifer DSM 44963]